MYGMTGVAYETCYARGTYNWKRIEQSWGIRVEGYQVVNVGLTLLVAFHWLNA